MHQLERTIQEQQSPAPIQLPRREGVRIGDLLVFALPDETALRKEQQRWLKQSYQVSETSHFTVCQESASRKVVLLHLFGQTEINADLICYIENELPSFGFILSEKAFGAVLFAIMAAPFPSPRNQMSIWQHFCLNTLTKLRQQIAHPLATPPEVSYIASFAVIYRRVFDLIVGASLLDVGCSFGFLPVLMAERSPSTYRIVGCDRNPDALHFSTALATAAGIPQICFSLSDLLSPDFPQSERFDTVTAIHLLEHVSEDELPVALTNLLQVMTKRLIIAVPYEKQIQSFYGHQQKFIPEKLHRWGQWCVEQLDGTGRYWYEEVMGGLLVVERG